MSCCIDVGHAQQWVLGWRSAVVVACPAGVIQLNRGGSPEVRSMGDETLSFLRRRADVSDLAAEPQPYQVVYWIPLCWQQRHPVSTLPPDLHTWLLWVDDSAWIVMIVRF